MMTVGVVSQEDEKDLINQIYKSVFNISFDEMQNIGKLWAQDTSKERALGHPNFEKQATEEEIDKYNYFLKITDLE